MQLKWPAIFIILLLGAYALLPTAAFARGSGNFYALGYINNPSDNLWFADEPSSECNKSLWYSLLSPLGGSETLWNILTILIILAGFASWFLFTHYLTGSKTIASLTAFLSFLLVDEWALFSLPLPRHVVLFILIPLGLYCFFKSFRENSGKYTAATAALFALMLSFHVLMALFFAFSLFAFFIGLLATKNKNTNEVFVRAAIAGTAGFILSLPFTLPSITSALGGIPHPVYSDYSRWGLEFFGVWLPNLGKVFYGKLIIAKTITLLCASVIALKLWKAKEEKIFLASNLALSIVFLATPLAGIVAKFITPGIFVEQWFWHTAPFALLAGIGIVEARRKWGKPAFALGILILLPSAIFLSSLYMNPPTTGHDFLGKQAISYFQDRPNAIVLGDIETSYLLPLMTKAKVFSTTLGYIVCPSNKTLARQPASNALFANPTLEQLKQNNITHVLINRKFWQEKLDKHHAQDGWLYPETFELAKEKFSQIGEPVHLDDVLVFEVT
ncbi:hypothetical protein HZC09_01275 [Candidatus Micrarchaeota archaeon]|nr:hypothetical protein [Candidatus Micrarchaeota archaeon]